MKTKDELNALKNEIEALNKKLADLTDEELAIVTGGYDMPKINEDEKYVMQTFVRPEYNKQYDIHIYK